MKLRIFCTALLIFPAIAMACVDTRSGNFCVSYKDIAQKSGDNELNLTRIYNSQSPESGWFGYGWGTPFETRLIVMPDGSAVIQDPSTRNIVRYAPKGGDALQVGVEKIVAVATERENLGVEAAAALRSRLLSSEEYRRDNVSKYDIQTPMPVGAKVYSGECAKAVVTRTDQEYQRITCEKRIDYFDLAGRLIRQEEKGYKLIIHYAGDRPDNIEDSLGQQLNLKWTATGHVAEVKTDKEAPVITYRYDEKNNLVFSSDAEGTDFRYEYDANHKMTVIGYADHTQMDMKYNEKGLVASVTETDGEKVDYSYRYDPEYPSLHRWTATTSSGTARKHTKEAEYFFTHDASGIEKLARAIKTEGLETEWITLDENEHIKRVQKSDGSFTEFSYHPTLGKVTMVLTNEGRTDYWYDKEGNLISVNNGKGQQISLDYDNHNSIIRMVETNKAEHARRVLTFRYNALHKPIKIKLAGKGEINVEYDKLGEISKVDSKQGAAMALEVTQAFQVLLALVKVAGVNVCL